MQKEEKKNHTQKKILVTLVELNPEPHMLLHGASEDIRYLFLSTPSAFSSHNWVPHWFVGETVCWKSLTPADCADSQTHTHALTPLFSPVVQQWLQMYSSSERTFGIKSSGIPAGEAPCSLTAVSSPISRKRICLLLI